MLLCPFLTFLLTNHGITPTNNNQPRSREQPARTKDEPTDDGPPPSRDRGLRCHHRQSRGAEIGAGVVAAGIFFAGSVNVTGIVFVGSVTSVGIGAGIVAEFFFLCV